MRIFCACGCGQSAIHRYVRGHNKRTTLISKLILFWSKVRLVPLLGWSDCMEWTGGVDHEEYRWQWTRIFGERRAHRIAWVATHGPIPIGLEPDHLCKNRSCIHPGHLELVSHVVNTRRGVHVKLTPELAEYIRSSTLTQSSIAKELNVAQTTISNVRIGRTWRVG